MTTHSFERRAAKRNLNQAKRAPLFAWGGLLEEWTAQRVMYEALGRDIASYEHQLAWERDCQQQLGVYFDLLDEAMTIADRDAVVAEMLSKYWVARDLVAQLDYLNRYLAVYQQRTPLEVFEEAKRRQHKAPSAG